MSSDLSDRPKHNNVKFHRVIAQREAMGGLGMVYPHCADSDFNAIEHPRL
jgi:hypothetical protein